jgi:hypothetical protein
MEILILLLLLQIKHCYADFVLQTYMQTVKKGVWMDPIGISHTLDHIYCSLIALLVFSLFVPISAIGILLVSFVEGIVHYLVDYTKVKYGSKDNTTPLYWNQFGLDQLAHQLSYIAIVWFICVYN